MKKTWMKLAAAALLIMMAGIMGCGQKAEKNNYESVSAAKAEKVGGEREKKTEVEKGKTDTGKEADIDAVLEAYRMERENNQSKTPDGYDLIVAPNEENYDYGVGDDSYTARFDSRELNLAFKEAARYVEEELQADASSVHSCVDPRMTAIYEDADKGVAKEYDADNIFLCEYREQEKWQYLILVREKKGADWNVLFHGGHYKTNE